MKGHIELSFNADYKGPDETLQKRTLKKIFPLGSFIAEETLLGDCLILNQITSIHCRMAEPIESYDEVIKLMEAAL